MITHGHEDHIGALPYILQKINVPVYGTKLTIALIENKLKEHNLMKNDQAQGCKARSVHQSRVLSAWSLSRRTTASQMHRRWQSSLRQASSSIPETSRSITRRYSVMPSDLQRFAELGKKGRAGAAVLTVPMRSARALPLSERTVGKTFDAIFAEHKNNRIIVATFASNVDRVQQIINTAYKYGRKVVVEGRSMVNVIGTASELGYINIPENTLIDIDQLKNYPDEETVLITTGSQGESMAALSRMAAGHAPEGFDQAERRGYLEFHPDSGQ